MDKASIRDEDVTGCDRASCINIYTVIAIKFFQVSISLCSLIARTEEGGSIESNVTASTIKGKSKNVAVIKGNDGVSTQVNVTATTDTAEDAASNVTVTIKTDVFSSNINGTTRRAIYTIPDKACSTNK